MAWTVVGIFGGFALGCLGLLTWVIGRLETNVGQRFTEQGAVFGAAFDRLERLVESRFSEVGRRFDVVEGRLDRVEGRLGRLEDEVRGLRADLTDHIAHHPA